MLRHQFSQNLILRLDLLLQMSDSLLFGLMAGPSSLLKSRGSILEELLLPAVEHRRLEPPSVAAAQESVRLEGVTLDDVSPVGVVGGGAGEPLPPPQAASAATEAMTPRQRRTRFPDCIMRFPQRRSRFACLCRG